MDTQNALTTTPFEEMEKADEQMVLDEIKGRSLDALIYEIQQRGQTITGLSLAGVRETARVMNQNGKSRIGMSEREPIITETEDYFEVKAYAQDTLNGGGYWGIKRQDKRYRNGENPFALEQALAKAQRNALRGLIPEWFVKEMIDAWRKQGKVKTIEQAPIPMPKHGLPTGPGIQTHKTDDGDGVHGDPVGSHGTQPARPYSLDILRRAIISRAEKTYAGRTITAGHRGQIIGALDALLGGNTDKRHEFLFAVTGHKSSKDIADNYMESLWDWVNGDLDTIKAEANNALVESLKAQGQTELPQS